MEILVESFVGRMIGAWVIILWIGNPMSETFPRVGSALLVRDEANRILLGQRNKDPQRGAWVIPGGKIHAFESIAEAAAREIEEETGLKVEVQNRFGVYEILNPPAEHRIVIYSWGKLIGGTPRASDDLSEVKLFSLDQLGDVPTTPLVRKVLADAGLIARETLAAAPENLQLNLFEGIVRSGYADGLGFRGVMWQLRQKLGRGFQRPTFSTFLEWLRTRAHGIPRVGEGQRLPIPIAGASEELVPVKAQDRPPRKKRRRRVQNTPLLFDMHSAT